MSKQDLKNINLSVEVLNLSSGPMSEPEGIIHPPPELRDIIDRTAQYVAKNGRAFEEKLINSHKGKPKFSFLLHDDPFNAYYHFKVREIRANLLGDLESKSSQDSSKQASDRSDVPHGQTHQDSRTAHSSQQNHDNNPKHEQYQDSTSQQEQRSNNNDDEEAPDSRQDGAAGTPRVKPRLDDYIREMTMKHEEPPPLFLAAPARPISRLDYELILLVCQKIASYGRSFLIDLVSREQNNSEYDFLKPQHGQFSYLTNLIMYYALKRNGPLDIAELLSKDANNKKQVIDKIKMRAEWMKMLELERKKREEELEKERTLYGQIDWHDFVIVETIDYTPDEKGEYPPTTADQVGTRLLLQQRFEEQTVPEEMDIDMDVDSDQEEDNGDQQTNDEFAVPLLPDASSIVIRKDYDPKAIAKAAQPDAYFVSPITNERIPVNRISDHVKYNLSDPRHLEKKDTALQGRLNEEQVFAAGSQIQDALKNLAERRTDIFGMDDKETDIGRRIGEEEPPKSKDDRLVWDGYKSSLKKKKTS